MQRAYAGQRLFSNEFAGGEQGGVGEVLRGFEASSSGVLIGTQMVAKGHDFRDVTLGVVLDADDISILQGL